MGNRQLKETAERIGLWGFEYSKESARVRRHQHRARRRKTRILLAQGRWEDLPEPKGTEGWITW